MASGGHARSGPTKVEGSRDSDRQGFKLSALPAAGYDGPVPDLTEFLPAVTSRHADIWAGLWSTPQAFVWAIEPFRWPVVADLVKWMVRSDSDDASAAVATVVRQLRDDLGLSSAGLRQNGWKIADVESGPVRPEHPVASNVTDIRERFGA